MVFWWCTDNVPFYLFNVVCAGTMSSAGTTLMIPDCELASMRTSDAFYLKQTVYTFAVPCLVGLVVCSWSAIVVVSVWWDR